MTHTVAEAGSGACIGESGRVDMVFEGDSFTRGRAAMLAFREAIPRIVAEAALAIPFLEDPASRRWLDASWGIVADYFPDVVEFIEGTAVACEVLPEALFALNHRNFLDVAAVPAASLPRDEDGCSTGGSRWHGGGAWVAKNRDNAYDKHWRHFVARHRDPAWGGRAMAVTSTIGGATIASSGGINTDGFCVVSTAIDAHRPPPGVFRNLLLGGLLSRCTRVEEALALVASVPHLGGTITMADATGDVATVELDPDAIIVERASGRAWVARTNHFCSRSVRNPEEPDVGKGPANSTGRLATMQDIMAGSATIDEEWPVVEARVVERMTAHDGDGGVCRHDEKGGTVATTLFTTYPPTMVSSVGPGCGGRWVRWSAAEESSPLAPSP